MGKRFNKKMIKGQVAKVRSVALVHEGGLLIGEGEQVGME